VAELDEVGGDGGDDRLIGPEAPAARPLVRHLPGHQVRDPIGQAVIDVGRELRGRSANDARLHLAHDDPSSH
jgi:hypothetical protein